MPIFTLIGYPVLGLAIGALYVSLLRRRATRYATMLLVLFVLWGGVLAFFTVYTFGGAFGLGMLLLCFSPVSALVVTVGFVAWRKKSLAAFGPDPRLRRLYRIGALVLFMGQLTPFAGVYGFGEGCDSLNYRIAGPIAEAMQAYADDFGAYPDVLEALVPGYLDSLPSPVCFLPGDHAARYTVETCRTGEMLITWPGLTGVSIERINLATGNWGGISFLDGACSFLP
ncbi:MAG: hypothetical protein JW910_05215 [Anaerolineae bacterium]|nr:hypothetical protein [Anaerolineae bacterium]